MNPLRLWLPTSQANTESPAPFPCSCEHRCCYSSADEKNNLAASPMGPGVPQIHPNPHCCSLQGNSSESSSAQHAAISAPCRSHLSHRQLPGAKVQPMKAVPICGTSRRAENKSSSQALQHLQETGLALNRVVLEVCKATPLNENTDSVSATIAKCCLKRIFSHLLYTCSIIEYQMPSFSHPQRRKGPICCTCLIKENK